MDSCYFYLKNTNILVFTFNYDYYYSVFTVMCPWMATTARYMAQKQNAVLLLLLVLLLILLYQQNILQL